MQCYGPRRVIQHPSRIPQDFLASHPTERVDGLKTYPKAETGRQADPGEVLAAFEELIPGGARRYGS